MILIQILVFLIGGCIVAVTVFSAIKTFIVPRGVPDRLTRLVFMLIYALFRVPLKAARSYSTRERIMAFYAPITMISMVPIWYTLIILGYMCIYWAIDQISWYQAFFLSGSSLLTLGFASPDSLPKAILVFSEATLGLILVALLIAYLPTMYAAFSRRETAVTMLEVRAGDPPSAVEMILRYNRIHGLDRLSELWQTWENWFADIEESHTSLQPLVFFRSPRADRSWINAAGAVLDAAALTRSVIDIPADPQADLCIRAGFLTLRRIADLFDISYNPDSHYPDEPISVTRAEFDAACERLADAGISIKPNRYQAWQDFAGWRINYDKVLLALASLTMAPEAPWISDRKHTSTKTPTPFHLK